MSQQPPDDWRQTYQRLIKLAARCKVPIPQPRLKPKPGAKPLKGVLLPRCYQGHLYTPDTTGERIVAGNVVRKCLTCERIRLANAKPRKPKCGTCYAYRLHRKRGEDCPRCKDANAKMQAHWREVKKDKLKAGAAALSKAMDELRQMTESGVSMGKVKDVLKLVKEAAKCLMK